MRDYYVVVYSTDKRTDDEWVIARYADLEKAKQRARDEKYFIERDKRKDVVEIRAYEEDIDLDDCTNFDYNTIEF